MADAIADAHMTLRDWHAASKGLIPAWVGWALAGVATVFVVAIALDDGVGRREVVIPLLAAVTFVVWYLPSLGVRVPDLARAATTLGVIGFVNAAADRFGFATDTDDGVQLSLLIAMILVGELVGTAPWSIAAAAVVGMIVITSPQLLPYDGDQRFAWIMPVGLAVMTGGFIRSMMRALTQLSVAQEALAHQAASDERRRIAREIHDVVAHSLTVTMLHLTAARLAVARGASGEATDALEEAERAGRQSLADVRRTVGLLRTGAGRLPDSEAPMPLAVDVVTLVDEYRDAGLGVELVVDGDLATVEPGVGLALYRIVQESLANVARHAPGATVAVSVRTADPARVAVRSRGGRTTVGGPPGSGITGMRERAEALGGRCSAGPDGDCGWVVEAVL